MALLGCHEDAAPGERLAGPVGDLEVAGLQQRMGAPNLVRLPALLPAAGGEKRQRPVPLRLEEIRRRCEHAFVDRDGGRRIALVVAGGGEVVGGVAKPRLECQRPAEGGLAFGGTIFLKDDVAAIVVGLREIGLESQRAIVTRERFARSPERQQDISAVAIGGDLRRVEREGHVVVGQGLVCAPQFQ